MVKRALICSIAALFLVLGFGSNAFSTDAGPVDLKFVRTKATKAKQPPAEFPHKKHQDAIKCGECHHGIQDGKQTPYIEGMEIQKCASCHNKDTLAGKTKGKNKLDTLKGAGHGNCKDCHTKIAKEDSSKKKLKSCKTCHKK